jgi:hypothetical protein
MARIQASKVMSEETRQLARYVVEEVYLKEKQWIRQADNEISAHICQEERYSWFLATANDKPAGVLRLFYDPPLILPAEYQVSLREGVNLDKIGTNKKFVEIGRFMILPEYRQKYHVALRLMGTAVREVVERGYTHFITDVFEGEPHSPLKFHTTILGFEVIGSHLHGELNCSLTRIILILDIVKAYKRLKERRQRLCQSLFSDWQHIMEKKLAV